MTIKFLNNNALNREFFNSMFLSSFLRVAAATILACLSLNSFAISPDAHPRLQTIFDELVSAEIYTENELRPIYSDARFKQSVLDAMTSPAEYKLTWGKYRKIFIQPERIQQGVDFWLEHKETLQRAEQEYGVPASMIVSILGVESKFGRIKGSHRVIDSLFTLVMGFERRSEFFASELKHFLILAKENQLDASAIKGSYAGAVGFPQFISSSYRNYAVDFNGDGITDLIDQPADAIGSIANYFVENGWKESRPVTSRPHANVPSSVSDLASRKRKTQHAAGDLRAMGAPVREQIDSSEKLGVLRLNINEIVPDDARKDHYLVRAGDTACQIAEAHEVPCVELFRLNKLNANGDIYRGQRLKLPATANASKQPSNPASAEIPRYFFTHHNFYVITRYNQSVLYAMAVNDLSAALDIAYQRRISLSQPSTSGH